MLLGLRSHFQSIKSRRYQHSQTRSISEGILPEIIGDRSNIFIRESPSKGRGLHAQRKIPCGETILKEDPFASWPDLGELVPSCRCCFAHLSSKRDTCKSCSSLYCGPQCQMKAFNSYHEFLCNKIEGTQAPASALIQSSGPRKLPLIAAKIYASILAGVQQTNSFASTWEKLLLLDHAKGDRIPSSDRWPKDYESFHKDFLESSPTNAKFFNYDWFHRVMSILIVNSFFIRQHDASRLQTFQDGTGLYILSSFFNHSCAPNAEYFFENSHQMHIRSTRDIQQNEEITIPGGRMND
eukprot:TRINITY_DN7366_c0_g1_i2.p1 TRINITY_DN7366_c0_g1~~TRINITY_DN7366_c0_g1_i2.p1  ORF type:complete len:296 (-),score=47.97 TRINITY_DN7366_c0_g1_i2:9-896(-)